MSSYSEVPIGIALIVCDTIIEDKLTNKKSLIGLFGQIHAGKLPCLHRAMSLLVSLTGGNGQYPCEIVCQHATEDTPVFKLPCTINFESPTQVLDLVFQLKAIRFSSAGQYWIKVLIDDIPIMMRPLTVICKQAPEPPAAPEQPTPENNDPPSGLPDSLDFNDTPDTPDSPEPPAPTKE